MSILDFIIADKQIEVVQRKMMFPIPYLEASPLFDRQSISLVECLSKSASGIIAEHKRRSPSKQNINSSLSVAEVASSYEKAGACGMSVLTDGKYFGGSLDDLNLARSVTSFPILRKEFIIEPYQVFQSRVLGADCILLIAACLEDQRMEDLAMLAISCHMDVLIEVHNLEELKRVQQLRLPMVGINNRNLRTFDVTLQTTIELLDAIDDDTLVITESGILGAQDVKLMKAHNIHSFLVGEAFMRQKNPGQALEDIFS